MHGYFEKPIRRKVSREALITYEGKKYSVLPQYIGKYVEIDDCGDEFNVMLEQRITGWKKVDGKWDYLMPGNNKYTVELPGRLSGYGFNRDMNHENLRYLPKLLNSVAPSRIMYPLIAYAFLSVLNTFLKEAGHEPKNIFVLMGKTGSKKSTLAALILSLFGSFSVTDLPMSFRDTQNSMELFMYYLMDALTVVDDFHPTKAQDKAKQEAQFQSMCRLIGNRSARGRLNSNCEYRTDRVPKCNAIVTAEFLPDIGESGTARLFPLRLNSNDINNDELTEFQSLAAKGVLSSTMFQFIEYLICFLQKCLAIKHCLPRIVVHIR